MGQTSIINIQRKPGALTAFLALLIAVFTLGAAPLTHAAEQGSSGARGYVVDQADAFTDTASIQQTAEQVAADTEHTIAVLTIDTPHVTADNYDEDVISYLKGNPVGDFQAEDGTLPQDTVLITISPKVRQLGAYAGDENNISRDDVEAITGAMIPHAQDANWDQAAHEALAVTSDRYAPTKTRDDTTTTVPNTTVGLIAFLGTSVLVGGTIMIVIVIRWARITPPEPEEALATKRTWQAMRSQADHPDVPTVTRARYATHQATEFLNNAVKPGGKVSRSNTKRYEDFANKEWQEKVQADIGYYRQTPGTNWEDRWAARVNEARDQTTEAILSAEELLENPDTKKLGKQARKIANTAAEQIEQINDDVLHTRTSTDTGEEQLRNVIRNLKRKAKEFRTTHSNQLPERDSSNHYNNSWFIPALVGYTAGTHASSSGGGSTSSGATFGSFGSFGGGGGFTGGSTGF